MKFQKLKHNELLVKGCLNVCGHYSFSLLFSEQAYNHGCVNHWSHSGEQLRCYSKALWFCAQTHEGIKCEVWFLLFLLWLTTNSSSYTTGESKAQKWQDLRTFFFFLKPGPDRGCETTWQEDQGRDFWVIWEVAPLHYRIIDLDHLVQLGNHLTQISVIVKVRLQLSWLMIMQSFLRQG